MQLENQPRTIRKLIAEVIDAKDLLPKDRLGSSSSFIVVNFNSHKKCSSTVYRNLNPVWNKRLTFTVSDPRTIEFEEFEIEVFNDKKLSNGSARKNCFLGRVKLYCSQFARRRDEGFIYFSLEKNSVFSWIEREIGLKIYYFDEIVNEQEVKNEGPPLEK